MNDIPNSFKASNFAEHYQEIEIAREKLAEKASVKDKLSAMKSLVGMISEGFNASTIFPEVVKTIICPHPMVQRLVYVYLMYYAEFKPEEALLSVNTFQMHLKDSNAAIRTQSLRVLTSIRLPVIAQIQIIAIQQCIKDTSPYVRKAAVHSIIKVFAIAPKKFSKLLEFLEVALADSSLFVLGSAFAAFSELCPARMDLIHPHYRRYCGFLLDFNHWGQVYLLNILTHYARDQFKDPNPKIITNDTNSIDSEDEWSEESEIDFSEEDIDPDLQLLLKPAIILLHSSSNAVVGAAASLIFYCAPNAQKFLITRPLLRVVRDPRCSFMGLNIIRLVSYSNPELFTGCIPEFYLLSDENINNVALKFDILTNLMSDSTAGPIAKEYEYYITHDVYYQKKVILLLIETIGRCFQKSKTFKEKMIPILLNLLHHKDDEFVSQCLIQIKRLVQHDPKHAKSVIVRIRNMDWMNISSVESRACIIWMFGEYCSTLKTQAPDTLRVLLQNFTKEEILVKQQILNFAAKLFALIGNRVPEVALMFQYTCKLCNYDVSYDLRDRSRMYEGMLLAGNEELRKNAQQLVCCTKPSPIVASSFDIELFLGSLSQCLNYSVVGHRAIEHWNEYPSDVAARGGVLDGNEGWSVSKVGCTGIFGDENSESSDSYSDYDSSEESIDDVQSNPVDAFFGISSPEFSNQEEEEEAEASVEQETDSRGSFVHKEFGLEKKEDTKSEVKVLLGEDSPADSPVFSATSAEPTGGEASEGESSESEDSKKSEKSADSSDSSDSSDSEKSGNSEAPEELVSATVTTKEEGEASESEESD